MNTIDTSAEASENAAIPVSREVHCGPVQTPLTLPPALLETSRSKSPAQWAYERIINYIRNFEAQLDAEHEIGLGMVGGGAGSLKIKGLGYFDPDLITFYGETERGDRTQLIQHVSQLNVMLVAAPKQADHVEPTRIGFQLAKELERDTNAA